MRESGAVKRFVNFVNRAILKFTLFNSRIIEKKGGVFYGGREGELRAGWDAVV
jgi:hypothetical protein